MSKKIIVAIALVALVGAGAFAQIALGMTGAVYSDTSMSAGDVIDRFQDGEGIFYGPFIELGLGKLALGLSGNFSFYTEDWNTDPAAEPWYIKLVDYDVALYIQGHLLGYKSVFDPFLEAGIGVMARDFANEEDDPDPDNPLVASKYTQAGFGLGLNFGALGIFTKVIYMFPFGTVEGEYKDAYGNIQTYDLGEYPLKKLKVFLGAKLIL